MTNTHKLYSAALIVASLVLSGVTASARTLPHPIGPCVCVTDFDCECRQWGEKPKDQIDPYCNPMYCDPLPPYLKD